MKRKLKVAISFLTVASMLVSTGTQTISFAAEATNDIAILAEATDNSFMVWLTGDSIPAGPVEGTNGAVILNKGVNGEDVYTKKSGYEIEFKGQKYDTYNAGKRENKICDGLAAITDETGASIIPNGQCVIFKAPANGIFITYLSAGNGLNIYEYGTDGKKIDANTINLKGAIKPMTSVKVQKDNTYIITTTKSTNNCFYGGFQFLQDAPVEVPVTIDASTVDFGSDKIQLIDDATTEVAGEIGADTTSITLTKNHTYILRSSSIDKKATLADGTTTTFVCTEGEGVSVKLSETSAITVSGEITSDNENADISEIKAIIFKSLDYEGSDYTFTDAIEGNQYTVELKPGEYETVINANGFYKTWDHVSVPETGSVTNEVYLEATGKLHDGYESVISAGTHNLDEEFVDMFTMMTFNGNCKVHGTQYGISAGDDASITFPVAKGQTIEINGSYAGTWEISGNGGGAPVLSSGSKDGFTATYVVAENDTMVTVRVTEVGTYGGGKSAYLKSIVVTNPAAPSEKPNKIMPGTYNLDEEIANDGTKFVFGSGTKAHSAQYGISAGVGATITLPVVTGQAIEINGSYCGTWEISGNGGSGTPVQTAGDTSGFTAKYEVAPGDTEVTITVTEVGNFGKGGSSAYLKNIIITGGASEEDYNFVSTINVPGDYDTLTEAVAAIKDMTRPDGEEGRVTINLTADIQEQVVINAPYVAINGNGHTIHWYYGQIGTYYSVDENGYYSERLFRDKYEQRQASGTLWGGVVIVNADYFKAENVTFKNTFNYEVTDKEIEDGAWDTALGTRTKGMDVQCYADKERSNALLLWGSYGEFYNCNILSSQDTLGCNGERDTVNYFRDCTIGGNVDFICGAGALIFDDCTLQWKTYTQDTEEKLNNSKIGYLVAPKSKPYIFRNCKITEDGNAGSIPVLGQFGRTWGANSTAYFINTQTNGLASSWGEMNKGDNTTSKFYEYNSYNTVSGESNAPAGYGKEFPTMDLFKEIASDEVIQAHFKGWTPSNYKFNAVDLAEVKGLLYKGDANADGTIDVEDATEIMAKVFDNSYKTGVENMNGNVLNIADLDGDKFITSADAAIVIDTITSKDVF